VVPELHVGYQNARVRFNSFEESTGIAIDNEIECAGEDIEVVGNLAAWDGCDDDWLFAYNAWSVGLNSGACSDTDRTFGGPVPYREPRGGATMDFHLAGPPGPADDMAPASACPATDHDGQPRAVAGTCDAGANERAGEDPT
jgi:hypothetical protein